MGRPTLLSAACEAMRDSLPSVRGDARNAVAARHAVSNSPLASGCRVAPAANSSPGRYDATAGPTVDDPLRLGGQAGASAGTPAGGR